MRKETRFLVSGAGSATIGLGLARPGVQRKTPSLVRSHRLAINKLKKRRGQIARVPSIYIGHIAQKSLDVLM